MTTQSAAPANLDRLRGMQTTSTALELETVPQTGRKADQLRANLANIQMPPGFSIGLYAIVPAAEFFYEGLNIAVVVLAEQLVPKSEPNGGCRSLLRRGSD
ncbi:MAG TPA: hypothetical protein VGC15_10015 [Acetobacteraceae bacterium]